MKDKALFIECNDDGGEIRYELHLYDNGIPKKFVPIGLVIEVQYVNDVLLQSSKLLSGREAIITILANSYSQNRLSELLKKLLLKRLNIMI